VDIVVAELNVSLSNIDLILVVQIITDLQLTGQVQAVQDDLIGELVSSQRSGVDPEERGGGALALGSR
jgi:hypothetical protein